MQKIYIQKYVVVVVVFYILRMLLFNFDFLLPTNTRIIWDTSSAQFHYLLFFRISQFQYRFSCKNLEISSNCFLSKFFGESVSIIKVPLLRRSQLAIHCLHICIDLLRIQLEGILEQVGINSTSRMMEQYNCYKIQMIDS